MNHTDPCLLMSAPHLFLYLCPAKYARMRVRVTSSLNYAIEIAL